MQFYRDALGFEVMQMWQGAAFLSFGGYHHHLGLNTWESSGGSPPAPGSTGLYHFAILYPTRRELARALRRLLDHGVSEALYLHDPDGNGIELYWDRDASKWPRNPDGSLAMIGARLDVKGLLDELEEGH